MISVNQEGSKSRYEEESHENQEYASMVRHRPDGLSLQNLPLSKTVQHTDNRILLDRSNGAHRLPFEPKEENRTMGKIGGRQNLRYTIADGGKIKDYNFEILGEETLSTPLGKLDTVKLERHKPNSRRKSTLWCAKKLEFLPVKVENVEKDGRITTALIKSLDGIAY